MGSGGRTLTRKQRGGKNKNSVDLQTLQQVSVRHEMCSKCKAPPKPFFFSFFFKEERSLVLIQMKLQMEYNLGTFVL